MKRLHITNQTYYIILIACIACLLMWNVYSTMTSQNLIGLISISIQSVLIILLLTKNVLSQQAIKLWLILFWFISQGLIVVGLGLQSLGAVMQGEEGGMEFILSSKMLYSLVYIIVGVILWDFNKEFGTVETSEVKE